MTVNAFNYDIDLSSIAHSVVAVVCHSFRLVGISLHVSQSEGGIFEAGSSALFLQAKINIGFVLQFEAASEAKI